MKYHTWPRIPMGKWQTYNETPHHKLEPRGQPFPSSWTQGTNKQTCTKAEQTQDRKTQMAHKKVPPCNGQVLPEGLNQFYGANLTFNSDVDQDTFGKVTKHNEHDSQEVSPFPAGEVPLWVKVNFVYFGIGLNNRFGKNKQVRDKQLFTIARTFWRVSIFVYYSHFCIAFSRGKQSRPCGIIYDNNDFVSFLMDEKRDKNV